MLGLHQWHSSFTYEPLICIQLLQSAQNGCKRNKEEKVEIHRTLALTLCMCVEASLGAQNAQIEESRVSLCVCVCVCVCAECVCVLEEQNVDHTLRGDGVVSGVGHAALSRVVLLLRLLGFLCASPPRLPSQLRHCLGHLSLGHLHRRYHHVQASSPPSVW